MKLGPRGDWNRRPFGTCRTGKRGPVDLQSQSAWVGVFVALATDKRCHAWIRLSIIAKPPKLSSNEGLAMGSAVG